MRPAATPPSPPPPTLEGAPRSGARAVALAGVAVGAIVGTLGARLPAVFASFVYDRLDRPKCESSEVLGCLVEGFGEFLLFVVLVLAAGAIMAVAGVMMATAGLHLVGRPDVPGAEPDRRDLWGFVLIAGGTALGMPALWVVVLAFISVVVG